MILGLCVRRKSNCTPAMKGTALYGSWSKHPFVFTEAFLERWKLMARPRSSGTSKIIDPVSIGSMYRQRLMVNELICLSLIALRESVEDSLTTASIVIRSPRCYTMLLQISSGENTAASTKQTRKHKINQQVAIHHWHWKQKHPQRASPSSPSCTVVNWYKYRILVTLNSALLDSLSGSPKEIIQGIITVKTTCRREWLISEPEWFTGPQVPAMAPRNAINHCWVQHVTVKIIAFILKLK